MSDSSSFSSLLALVNSHLSKTSIQESHSEETATSFNDGNSQSDTGLAFSPGQRLPIPNFTFGTSPIDNILAEQVSNMLKAKVLRKQEEEEKLRLEEEMKRLKLEEENEIIDLTKALQTPSIPQPQPRTLNEVLSNSSSFESLFEPKFIDCDVELERTKTPEPLLPCITDMSYMLKRKVKSGKCSSFGKVLTSRLRPVAAPYIMIKIDSTVRKFDFSTPSPCDINKEKLRKPSGYNAYNTDLFGISMVPS